LAIQPNKKPRDEQATEVGKPREEYTVEGSQVYTYIQGKKFAVTKDRETAIQDIYSGMPPAFDTKPIELKPGPPDGVDTSQINPDAIKGIIPGYFDKSPSLLAGKPLDVTAGLTAIGSGISIGGLGMPVASIGGTVQGSTAGSSANKDTSLSANSMTVDARYVNLHIDTAQLRNGNIEIIGDGVHNAYPDSPIVVV
jgi:hypothetical protein